MIFLKEFFERINLEKKQTTKENVQNYPVGKELHLVISDAIYICDFHIQTMNFIKTIKNCLSFRYLVAMEKEREKIKALFVKKILA